MAQVDVVNVEATGPDVVPNENQSCIDLVALKEKKPGVIRAKYENSRNEKGMIMVGLGAFFLGEVCFCKYPRTFQRTPGKYPRYPKVQV